MQSQQKRFTDKVLPPEYCMQQQELFETKNYLTAHSRP